MASNGENGSDSVITTVDRSGASTDSITSYSWALGDPNDSSRSRLSDATTSWASKVLPSWNTTPSRRSNSHTRPSELVLHDSASAGMSSPSGAGSTSVSYTLRIVWKVSVPVVECGSSVSGLPESPKTSVSDSTPCVSCCPVAPAAPAIRRTSTAATVAVRSSTGNR